MNDDPTKTRDYTTGLRQDALRILLDKKDARIREQRDLLEECERHLEWVIAEGNGSISTKRLYAKLRGETQ